MQAAQIMAQERVYAQEDKGLGQHAEKKTNQQAGYDDLYAMQDLVQEKMKDDLFLSGQNGPMCLSIQKTDSFSAGISSVRLCGSR